MANIASARKRARQNEKRRKHNAARQSMLRTQLKKVKASIRAGDADGARAAMREAEPLLDRLARRGLIHKNNAARNKRHLSARIRALDNG